MTDNCRSKRAPRFKPLPVDAEMRYLAKKLKKERGALEMVIAEVGAKYRFTDEEARTATAAKIRREMKQAESYSKRRFKN